MIYNYTSSKEVIAKVMSDLDMQEESHRIADMMEWVSEAMEKIGAVTQLKHQTSGVDNVPILEVKDFQATLPTDLYRLDQVAFSFTEDGEYQSMRYSTNTMDIRTNINMSAIDYSTTMHYYVNQSVRYQENTYICIKEHNASGTDPKVPNTTEGLDYWKLYVPYSELLVSEKSRVLDLQYFLVPGYIKTNVANGFIRISYQATRLDDEGMPMIPDLASYKEAIYWYINMKLSYVEWRLGKMKDAVYYDAKRSWNFYRQQAYAEALMPGDADQMKTIQNVWNKVYPEMNEHGQMFATMGQEQKVYNNYYGRIY